MKISNSNIKTPPTKSYEEIISPYDNIQLKLQNIKEIFNLPSLYSRYWLSFTSYSNPRLNSYSNNSNSNSQNSHSNNSNNSNLQSDNLNNFNNFNKSKNFRIMQFNLLAEGLSSLPSNIPPFNQTNGFEPELSDCGGFDIDENANIIFNFHECRKWRLIEEILRYSPDVLSVEECDRFDDFFFPILQHFGYDVRLRFDYFLFFLDLFLFISCNILIFSYFHILINREYFDQKKDHQVVILVIIVMVLHFFGKLICLKGFHSNFQRVHPLILLVHLFLYY